jgi:Predicted glutamine amidotransferases
MQVASKRCADVVRALVTMRSIRDPDTGELRDSLSRDWTAYLDELNVTSVLVANGLEDPSARLSAIDPDVLLLTNGEDVGAHPPRDRTERALVEAAIEADVPVFGVCRGHQFLNQYYGGNVVELADKLSTNHNHDGTSHEVDILDGPPAAVLPDRIAVNSYHNDGVTTSHIAPPLKPFAISDDGVVEGLYHPELPVISIQWHPERPLEERAPTDRLISHWLEESRSG